MIANDRMENFSKSLQSKKQNRTSRLDELASHDMLSAPVYVLQQRSSHLHMPSLISAPFGDLIFALL